MLSISGTTRELLLLIPRGASLVVHARVFGHPWARLLSCIRASLVMHGRVFRDLGAYLLPCMGVALDLKRRISCHAEPLLWISRDVSLAMQSPCFGSQET